VNIYFLSEHGGVYYTPACETAAYNQRLCGLPDDLQCQYPTQRMTFTG
jgi:hypothetical protein